MEVTTLHWPGGSVVRGACVEEQPVGTGEGQALVVDTQVSWEKHQEKTFSRLEKLFSLHLLPSPQSQDT